MSQVVLPHTIDTGTEIAAAEHQANYIALRDKFNGNIDADNLTAAEAAKLGLSISGSIRRGKSIIATEEARTNTAYGLLATADRVSGVILPVDGLIFVGYQATWKSSVAQAGRAAIFIGASQLKHAVDGVAPTIQEATGPTTANMFQPLGGGTRGLKGDTFSGGGNEYTGDVTTGQLLGIDHLDQPMGFAAIFAAAGTYDVSVQFKSSSGSVTVKNRKLWVWTMSF